MSEQRARPDERPIDLSGAGFSGQRCPFCHDAVDAQGEAWTACQGCLARHHEACWSENGRCGSCGSAASLVPRTQATAPAPEPVPARPRAAGIVAATLVGALGAVLLPGMATENMALLVILAGGPAATIAMARLGRTAWWASGLPFLIHAAVALVFLLSPHGKEAGAALLALMGLVNAIVGRVALAWPGEDDEAPAFPRPPRPAATKGADPKAEGDQER